MHDRRRPVAVDLFAGAGGLSLGLERAGFDVRVAVEFDPIHAAIHELNFPPGHTATICESVRDLDGDDIRCAAGMKHEEIDAVVGGPPCQGFSLIGQRVLDDPRNDLVDHFRRLVVEIQPRLFVMENVPGMATGQHHRLLDELLERFDRDGYEVRHQILNAASFGVPQDRRRLFLIGYRRGASLATLPRHPAPTSRVRSNGRSNGHRLKLFEADLPDCPSVSDAIGDLPTLEDRPELFDADELAVELVGGSDYARRLRGDLDDPEDYSYRRQSLPGHLTGCLRARHTDLSRQRFADQAPGTTESISRFYKLSLDGISNTLRAGTASDHGAFSAPRPIHPIEPRCITVREAARLHSFPDWFRFHRTIWHGFREIGNAVAPFVGQAVGRELVRALGVQPFRPDETIPMGPAGHASFTMKDAAAYYEVPRDVIPPRQRILHA
ncbi:MAG: DNA cytosine methyltransferase [Chloroflexota bacterium]